MAVLARKVERSNITRTESNITGRSQLTSENDDDDGIEEEELITGNTTDLTRRRLRCLKSVLKSLLLDDRKDAFSVDDPKKECSEVEEKEAYPYMLILNALKPYIPKKKERIDGPSLYQTLTRLPCALAIFNYDNYLIESVEEARQNKYAVFSSLCDINAITMMYKFNGIRFAQNISLLPGTKTARLLGTKDTEESKKSKETLQQEMQGLQAEVTGIEKQLKDALKNEKSRNFSKEINGLKLKWRNSSLEEGNCLYNAMKQQSVIAHKAAIASENSNDQWYVLQKHNHGIVKVEDCRISLQANLSEEFIFSGTDSGLKTMTSTVPLTMKRFKFHLELRNKYKALGNTDECKEEAQKIVSKYSSEESGAKSFLQLPSSMAIKTGDIDIGSGYYNVRRKLEKAKKSTEGKVLQEIEDKLAKLDMKSTTSVKQAVKIYQQHVDNRIAFMNLYHSKKSQIEKDM
ncbi:uncharacterized protein RHIMIDRAFT_310176 [Rhizopus microsporus ATCC 52813]|uniref:Uncharacterized protein n=1 Tax=Rhizopus microsporus ATCC 52813 TaxID=1340429 RepID=A0A2G4T8Y2_RHIZD|nr:uncharacterized protein RHIMIDRAFT_310176 [Rhizopus microsporus ATCC 52813]PHZ17467.1 hypothetical protein RHIMIDRAFT_310176 [Rhizopus microsporus ATCC 52813]